MKPMNDADAVIRHASAAAAHHSDGVRRALGDFLMAPHEARYQSALRYALVAQAAGHEGSAHDGSTYEARCAAARAALAAWDGPPAPPAMVLTPALVTAIRGVLDGSRPGAQLGVDEVERDRMVELEAALAAAQR